MKTRWILITLVALTFVQADARAQSGNMVYPHWVIEGNANTRDYTLMRFYDERNQLILEEKLEGKFLDISRKRNVKMLNRRLNELIDSASLSGKQPSRKSKRKAAV